MRKLWSILVLLTMAATLTACGGDSNAFGTPGSSAATSAAVAKVSVAPSAATLPPDGTTATITVTATDANNVAVSGATVTFATSAGTLAVTSATTGANGQATATLSASGVAASTVITVTATTGGVSGKTTITVATTQQTLTLLTSVPQIPSNGSSTATITAQVLDAQHNVVPGVPVTFQASAGTLVVTQATTGTSGTATATLAAGTSPQNGTITVTATAGTSTSTVEVAVIGTALTLSGPTTLVQGASGTYSVALTDSGGAGVAGQTVEVSSANGNTLTNAQGGALPSPATVTTNSSGAASFTLTATGNNTNPDTITATWLVGGVLQSGAESQSQTLTVSNQKFVLTAPTANASIPVGQASAVPITLTWTDAGGTGQTGTVNFTTTRGTFSVSPASVQVTNGTPTSAITIYSTSAGPAIISATATQNGATIATAQVTVDFVATNPTTVTVQANPSPVAVQGQSTLTATVLDGNTIPNPVQGATVDFTILTDPTGGSLSAASAVTNAGGVAQVTYNAGSISSLPNAVSIQASVAGTTVTSTPTTLTVGGETVFLSLGTGNLISAPNSTQYEDPWTVTAVDAAGNAISNVTVTFSVQSVAYATGHWAGTGGVNTTGPNWMQYILSPNQVAGIGGCAPTQVYEVNGTIPVPQPSPPGTGYVLTNIPGLVASTDVTSAVTATTSATTVAGTAAVNVIYPQNYAGWVAVSLTATATVQGTQNSTTATFWLPYLATVITATAAPPGQISPFGQATSCYN